MTPTVGDESLPELSAIELQARLESPEPLQLVDVREPFERQIADLPEVGQLRIPVRDFEARLGELDPDAETVLYCRSGSRSAWATQVLIASGFGNVWNLAGGILAWREHVDPSLRAY